MENWQKRSPFIYDMMMTNVLDSLSTTIQWLPDVELWETEQYYEQQLIMGTNNLGDCENHLIVGRVRLPTPDAPFDYNAYRTHSGGFGGVDFKIDYNIKHNGQIKLARHMPHNKAIIGTISQSTGFVQIFNVNHHPPSEEVRLRTDGKECFGLSWNSYMPGQLLTCGGDCKIYMWDINEPTWNSMDANLTFRANQDYIEDVAWCQLHPANFASVGSDRRLITWDARNLEPSHSWQLHAAPINCVSYSPFHEHLLATGSVDCTVGVWDERKLDSMLYCLTSHESNVTQIQWSPHQPSLFASASTDGRVYMWDLTRIGGPKNEHAQTPAELIFIHAGHNNMVLDFSWNTFDPLTIASVSGDRRMHVWQMIEHIYISNKEHSNKLIAVDKDDDAPQAFT